MKLMDRDIQSILDKYGLTLVEIIRQPDEGGVRSYVLTSENPRGSKYTVKIFASKDPQAKVHFIKEIHNIRKIRSKVKSKFKDWVPNIKWYSKNGDNPYYIYKYVEGEPIGRFIKTFGIEWGNFRHKNFYEFLGFFDEIHKLSQDDLELPSWGYRVARKELQHYFENTKRLLPSDIYDKVVSFLDANQEKVFTYKNVSHRDLYPENIIIKAPGSRKFCFLDWEYMSEVPIGFDAAFLYLLFWREEYWKAKIMSYYYHKYSEESKKDLLTTFNLSFRLCLIVLAVRFIYQLNTFADRESSDYEHASLTFLYDLQTAISGEIIKPKNIKFYLSLNDIRKVADQYGINGVKNYTVFYASKGNTVAKVDTSSGAYIFRFYSESRSTSLITRELEIFERLTARGIKTYDVLRTLKNDLFLRHRIYGKSRKIAVLTYIHGRKIQQKWATEKSAVEVGQILKKIHDSDIIHGDFSKENVLFIKSKVSGVIDFEWGRFTDSRKAKFNDMAKAIALWLVDVRSKNIDEATFVKEFLTGYYGVLPDNAQFTKVKEAVINKINEEKSVFLTTIDKNAKVRHLGKRFDYAIGKINAM
jgi:tRNA A-37 threonylcarbamoyl transferase component Bud32